MRPSIMIFVTPKAGAEHELLFKMLFSLKCLFLEHLEASQQSVINVTNFLEELLSHFAD
jgi:hypothetical protein